MADLRDLDLRHLIAFDSVATEGTFGRAGERLGYTQSAVSQQIAALERIVGGKVFDRPGGPRPVELTPLGERVLVHARRVIDQVDVMAVDLDRFHSGQVGRLTIGTFQSVSAVLLPLLVGRMRDEMPDVEIVVFESDQDEVLEEALGSGRLDFSFLGDRSTGPFEAVHLLDDPYVLLARPGQYPNGPVRMRDIAGQPMIGQHYNSSQIQNEQGLRSAGIEPSYVFRTNDNGTVAAMVRAGMGIAVLPMLCTEPEDHRVALHPLRPPIPDRRIFLAWRHDRSPSPAGRRFVDLAVETGRQMADRLPAGATTA